MASNINIQQLPGTHLGTMLFGGLMFLTVRLLLADMLRERAVELRTAMIIGVKYCRKSQEMNYRNGSAANS